MTRILGLDQSLTSFGGARICSGPGSAVELHRWQAAKRLGHGHVRMQWLLDNVEEAAQGCDFALIEGLAYGAKGASLLDLAGLYHMVTHLLWRMDVPYVVVAPHVRAKYITGNARASKDECLVAAVRRFPDIPIDGNDTADAVTLGAMGADWMGFPLAKLPADQRAVLTSIVPAAKNKPAHPAIDWSGVKELKLSA